MIKLFGRHGGSTAAAAGRLQQQFGIYVVSRVWGEPGEAPMRGEVVGPFSTPESAIQWHMQDFPLPGPDAPAEEWMDPSRYQHLVCTWKEWMEEA